MSCRTGRLDVSHPPRSAARKKSPWTIAVLLYRHQTDRPAVTPRSRRRLRLKNLVHHGLNAHRGAQMSCRTGRLDVSHPPRSAARKKSPWTIAVLLYRHQTDRPPVTPRSRRRLRLKNLVHHGLNAHRGAQMSCRTGRLDVSHPPRSAARKKSPWTIAVLLYRHQTDRPPVTPRSRRRLRLKNLVHHGLNAHRGAQMSCRTGRLDVSHPPRSAARKKSPWTIAVLLYRHQTDRPPVTPRSRRRLRLKNLVHHGLNAHRGAQMSCRTGRLDVSHPPRSAARKKSPWTIAVLLYRHQTDRPPVTPRT